MMNCLQMVPPNPKQILNLTVNREKTLCMSHRLEPPHLAFFFSGVLVGDLRSIVLVLTGAMGD